MKEEHEFIPIYYDALFYKIFGDNNDLEPLKYLIKQILNIEPIEIEILNGKLLGDKYKVKRSYLDLQVKLKDNTKILIEVNTNKDKYIFDRNLFFLNKVMGNDLDVGEDYLYLNKHYQINLNVNLKQTKEVMVYKLMNDKTNEVLSDKIQIINIDISYFAKKCYTISDRKKLSEFEKIMGLLGSKDEFQTKEFLGEEGIVKHIMEKANKFRKSDELVELFDRDKIMAYDFKLEKEKAIEIEKDKKTKEIVINMIKIGISDEDIAASTGLTLDEINALK